MTSAIALPVAAHDPLGGAGLAADLTTFAALRAHGVCAVTAVTAQRFADIEHIEWMSGEFVARQLDGLRSSLGIRSMKTGLLGRPDIVEAVSDQVAAGFLPRPVVDPVMVDGRGARFVSDDVERLYRQQLFPLAVVITPNIGEAGLLVGRPLRTVADVLGVAPELGSLGPGLVVVTGGATQNDAAVDIVIHQGDEVELLEGPRVQTAYVRGSGCTFSAAIAGLAAGGASIDEAIRGAKVFVTSQLRDTTDWVMAGDAIGPISHRLAQGTSAHPSP